MKHCFSRLFVFLPNLLLVLSTCLLSSCGNEEAAETISPTKVAYDSLLAYLQKNPVEEEKRKNDSVFFPEQEKPKEENEKENSDSTKAETTTKVDSTAILAEACDLSLEKLETFSKKMLSILKKKRDNPTNEEIKKEYKKTKDEFFTWVKRVRGSNPEAAWQKNKCNSFPDKKEKAEKILVRLEEAIKQ